MTGTPTITANSTFYLDVTPTMTANSTGTLDVTTALTPNTSHPEQARRRKVIPSKRGGGRSSRMPNSRGGRGQRRPLAWLHIFLGPASVQLVLETLRPLRLLGGTNLQTTRSVQTSPTLAPHRPRLRVRRRRQLAAGQVCQAAHSHSPDCAAAGPLPPRQSSDNTKTRKHSQSAPYTWRY